MNIYINFFKDWYYMDIRVRNNDLLITWLVVVHYLY